MQESCATCRHKYSLTIYDYSHGGCEHIEMNGFVCMGLADIGKNALWHVGIDPEKGKCECYEPRDGE